MFYPHQCIIHRQKAHPRRTFLQHNDRGGLATERHLWPPSKLSYKHFRGLNADTVLEKG